MHPSAQLLKTALSYLLSGFMVVSVRSSWDSILTGSRSLTILLSRRFLWCGVSTYFCLVSGFLSFSLPLSVLIKIVFDALSFPLHSLVVTKN